MSGASGGPGRQRRQVLKVILLGDSGVGKTSLMRQYVTRKFEQRFKATIGADFFSKELDVDSNPVTLHIWDTAGQERFQSLGTAFYRGADVCILVFDITNAQTFADLNSWLQEFNFQSTSADGKKRHVMLVGNKADMKETKQDVYGKTIKDFCAENVQPDGEPMRYFEASAKANTGVEDLFVTAAQLAYRQKVKEMRVTEESFGVIPGSVSMSKGGRKSNIRGGPDSGAPPKKRCGDC